MFLASNLGPSLVEICRPKVIMGVAVKALRGHRDRAGK